jgi:rod shape-determining protein MreD
MAEFLYKAVLILLFAAFQTVIATEIKPDLILILTVYFAVRFGSNTGQFTGFFGGLLNEVSSFSSLFGLNMFYKTIVGFVAGRLKGKIFQSHVFIITMVTLIASVLKIPLFLLIEFLFLGATNKDPFDYMTYIMPFEIIINTSLAPLLAFVLKRIDERWMEGKKVGYL